MLRSLFIGFLILSSLTTKGVEAQVAENINNMPADALPGFFGTMPGQTEKTGDIDSVAAKSAFFCRGSINVKADGFLSGMVDNGAIPAWLEDNCRPDYRPGYVGVLPEQVCPFEDEAFYCVSGLSPPCFRTANDTVILLGFYGGVYV